MHYEFFPYLTNSQEEVLSEAVDLSELENSIGILFEANPDFFPSIFRWIAYFNDHFLESTTIHKYCVTSVISLFRSETAIVNQSLYELNLSMSFFDELYSQPYLIRLENQKEGDLILQIAILFGRYPGMIIRSLTKSLILLKTQKHNRVFELFELLFVKFNTPNFLVANLPYLTTEEAQVLMHVLQGNSLRSAQITGYKVSKKEAFLLKNVTIQIIHTDRIFLRSLIFVRLYKARQNPDLIRQILRSSQEYELDCKRFLNGINFWISVLSFLTDHEDQIARPMTHYIDFFDRKRRGQNKLKGGCKLKYRTIESVDREIGEWHHAIIEIAPPKTNFEWDHSEIEDAVIISSGRKYFFKELTSEHDLYNEGKSLVHCVTTYSQQCISGQTRVWSMSCKRGKNWSSLLTIQVTNEQVVQVAGMCNRKPESFERFVVEAWATKFELIYDC